MPQSEHLSRRERQVMDVIYELGEASAREVQQRLPSAPSYSAVRAVLTRLVEQGHLKYRESGPRYVYKAAEQRTRIRASALRRTVDTFFDGSAASAMNALLGIAAHDLSQDELDELAQAIEAAREKSRD
ncbi:MAG: BlaI/MecI/CopY family transcriptional regulator [Gammaproteobacteria bacterium]|jgi:predicted transcriptional regulator